MNFKQLIRDYFTFTRNERKGITVLVILIFLLALANKLIFFLEKPAKIDAALLDSARQKLGEYNDSVNQNLNSKALFFFNPNKIDSVALPQLKPSDVEPFLFDPNTATDDEFTRLGFSGKQIAAIRKYIGKGGVFKDQDDFFKIRVIGEGQKRILSGWIAIRDKKNEQAKINNARNVLVVEINSADSVQLEQLPGIGSVLAKRIIKYRDLLGGFYSISQLKEVYGLSDQTFGLIQDKVTVNASKIHRVDMNFADMGELSRHPYLKKELAKKIVKFRARNGSISDLAVLRDSMILNLDEYNRIKPYF